jgi:hypothetical protein
MRMFTERSVRRALIAIALAGLVSGAVAWANGRSDLASWCWAAGTLPVLMGLLISMIRDFLTGRVGVDSVAFVSMSGALFLPESSGHRHRDYVRRRQSPGGHCSWTSGT